VVDVTADDQEPIPLWSVDDDPGLRELLARPVEVPPQAPSTPPERALAEVAMPELSATATAIEELDHAAIGAVRTLKWAMAHAVDEKTRVSAARAVLDAALRRWQGQVVGDPLGDFVRGVVGAEPTGNGR
jgi:hypothetical protein